MSKRIGLILALLFSLFGIRAQQTLSFEEVDKKSYELFIQGKWHELIDYYAKVRKEGIDFFYLRARTGIAYFNIKKYKIAAIRFLEAYKTDNSLDWLQEYLYYSLVYSGRISEASIYASQFNVAVKQKLGFREKKITWASLEAGYSFNPDVQRLLNSKHGEKASVGSNYGEGFYLRNYHFESFDLGHQMRPGFFLNHNITYIGLNRDELVDWEGSNSFMSKTTQLQYFISPNFTVKKKFYVAPSLHIIGGVVDYVIGGLSQSSNKSFFSVSDKYTDYVFSISMWSHFQNYMPAVEMNYANISNANFQQGSASVTWYPLSNSMLYITPKVYFRNDENDGFRNVALGISVGSQLGPVHFYGNYLKGEMEHFIESGGYLVANFPGVSKQKISGSIYFPANKKYQLVLRYINQGITENYVVYTNGVKNSSLGYGYIKHTFTGGISWRF